MKNISDRLPLSGNNTNTVQNKYSRYVGGGNTEIQNNKIEWWERTVFSKDASDSVYVVENNYTNRLDLIAAMFYNESRLAWFVAQYNNIIDPTAEVVAGRVLLIPTPERMAMMTSGKKGGYPSKKLPVKTISPLIL